MMETCRIMDSAICTTTIYIKTCKLEGKRSRGAMKGLAVLNKMSRKLMMGSTWLMEENVSFSSTQTISMMSRQGLVRRDPTQSLQKIKNLNFDTNWQPFLKIFVSNFEP